MKKTLIHSLIIFSLAFFALTSVSFAQSGIEGNQPPATPSETSGYRGVIPNCQGNTCTWNDIIKTIDYLVDLAMGIALVFSSAVIAFAGFKYMSSGDNPGKRKEANTMLQKVVIGIVLVMGAWVIVNLIFTALGADQSIRFAI
jgi:hypothetical protein